MARVGVQILLNDDSHRPAPGHPENVRRLLPAAEYLRDQIDNGTVESFRVTRHDRSTITAVHSKRYIEQLETFCAAGGGFLDMDTYVTGTSFVAACEVVDVLLSAVDAAFTSNLKRSFVLVRPPGHHAEYDHAMGFCLINNTAVAAQYALTQYSLSRVAIVDFDVHHGNGTQHLFYDRDDVYFVSTHQYPFYPGSGAARETGAGAGQGFTLNIPLAGGAGDREVDQAFESKIVPELDRYRPELLLVSAGFDAHTLDPLAGLSFSGAAYRNVAERLVAVAEQHCGGRIVTALEGGYSPEGNLDAITNYIDGLVRS